MPYYGDNKNVCITGLDISDENIIQIYTADLPTSVNQTSTENISTYPNPTSGKIKIDSNKIIERITIFDISGKEILETKKTRNKYNKLRNRNVYFESNNKKWYLYKKN